MTACRDCIVKKLFDNTKAEYFDVNEDFTLADSAYLLCRGGWTISVQDDRDLGFDIMRIYHNSLFVFENSDSEKSRNKKTGDFQNDTSQSARNIFTETPGLL